MYPLSDQHKSAPFWRIGNCQVKILNCVSYLVEVSVDEWVGEGRGHAEQVTNSKRQTKSDVTGAPLLPVHREEKQCLRKGVQIYCAERESDSAIFVGGGGGGEINLFRLLYSPPFQKEQGSAIALSSFCVGISPSQSK